MIAPGFWGGAAPLLLAASFCFQLIFSYDSPVIQDQDAACSQEGGCLPADADQPSLFQALRRSGIGGAAVKTQDRAGPSRRTSGHLDAIVERMKTLAPKAEGKLWKLSDGNSFSPNVEDWLLQTPNCFGTKGPYACLNKDGNVPGTQNLADAMQRDIASATEWVDVTTLANSDTIFASLPNISVPGVDNIIRLEVATGIFRKAIVKGIAEAYSKHPNVTYRLYAGFPTGNLPNGAFVALDAYLEWAAKVTQQKVPFAKLMADAAAWNEQQLRDEISEIDGDAGKNAKITVTFGMTAFATSWNHAKIVAVDGKSIISGGHNLWDEDYNGAHPVTDMSIRIEGPAACMGHQMANVLWEYACDGVGCQRDKVNIDMSPHHPLPECPRSYVPATCSHGTKIQAGGTRVLAVGEMGVGMPRFDAITGSPKPAHDPNADCYGSSEINSCRRFDVDNPGMEARRMLVDGAKKSVFISQQDLIFSPEARLPGKLAALYDKNIDPCKTWLKAYVSIFDPAYYDARLFMSIARKLTEGLPVTIVISTPGNVLERMNCSSGYTVSQNLMEIVKALRHQLKQLGMNGAEADQTLCGHLSLASVRISDFSKWKPKKKKKSKECWGIEMHTKFISVDDEAFYVGSHNLYPTMLQEYGNIVEDASLGQQVRQAFMDPLWEYSKATQLDLC